MKLHRELKYLGSKPRALARLQVYNTHGEKQRRVVHEQKKKSNRVTRSKSTAELACTALASYIHKNRVLDRHITSTPCNIHVH